MPTALESQCVPQEQLRTFHLTGRGLDELAPPGPFVTEASAAVGADFSAPLVLAANLPRLHGKLLVESRKPSRETFTRMVAAFRDKLQTMLALGERRGEDALNARSLTAELGKDASHYFDTEAMSRALRRPMAGTKSLPADRHARLTHAVDALSEYLRQDALAPSVFQVTLAEALPLCELQLDRLTSALRALAVAGLECDSAYDPARHDEAVQRITWRAAQTAELAATPPVVVYETSERLLQSLTEFGQLAQSGLPVQIVITASAWGSGSDIGAIALAYRDSFILSESSGVPSQLMEGLREMAASLRSAVAIVAVPETADELAARQQSALMVAARLTPLFTYNPDKGDTLAQRLIWNGTTTPGISPLDAAASFPSMLRHFRLSSDAPKDSVPFVLTRDRRFAIVTQALENIARQRQSAWRFWEELAGVNNSFVAAAIDRTKAEMRQQQAAAVEQASGAARQEGARTAVTRLVIALTQSKDPIVTAAPSAPIEAKPAVPPPQPKAAESAVAADPYIDSFLCTSCNDCFKINNRLFQYNAEKQAYIADASAGTFAELVKAAENCPARCIHPGTPRAGDATATPALLAKAAKLG